MLRLVEIDGGNWRIPLRVAPSQKRYVADQTAILARAYAYRDSRSQAYILYADETPVGMVMYHDEENMDAYIFSELFIDQRYQGRGYGKEAIRLVLEQMKQDGKYHKAVLCFIEGNEGAKRLYEGFGFRVTDRDEEEIIMELEF